jgi:hypothetical protein
VDAPVVDNASLYYLGSAIFEDLGYTPTQKYVAQMAQMKGFVRVGRGVLYHYFFTLQPMIHNGGTLKLSIYKLQPKMIGEREVQKALDNRVAGDRFRESMQQRIAQLLT